MFASIISPAELQANLERGWLIADCRFSLADPAAGARQYKAGHIPTAVYVDLAADLSGPPLTDHGRHPLPSPAALTALFSRLGVGPATQVIGYDDASGAVAARLWWLLQYMGHRAAAVLDGGWPAWHDLGLPIEAGERHREPALFEGSPATDRVVTLADVPGVSQLVDAREPPRYRGERETIDPVAGHIPGAINRFWQDNLQDGRFLPGPALAAAWRATLGGPPDAETVHYCGSGVTACHNVLAQVVAGYSMPRLYVGSWSEWCRDPHRPVATQ